MRRVLWRCNSGHYFSVLHCPLDGWSFQGAKELFATVGQMHDKGKSPSIRQLKARGLSQEVLDRVIVVDFGGERSVFDGFSPEGYIIEDRYVPLAKLGGDYL